MSITLIFILLILIVVIVFDIYIVVKKGSYQSISSVIIRISKDNPIIPFVIGVLIGHLFWRMSDLSVWGNQ